MIAQVQLKQRMTAAEFDEFVLLPENADRLFEYISGEVLEVPSNPFVSMIAGLILTALNLYLRDNPIGYVTGEAGGYMIAGERYAPDVAFISKQKQPELARQGYNPNPPDLAVEVLSDPTSFEEQNRLRAKVSNYLADGVVVWVVDINRCLVEAHHPTQPMQTFNENDTLDGGAILPGFTLAVQDIFPAQEEGE